MKKLFTDPHFNVMDGLDTYIGDYTKEDPIPLEMLKDLAQSRMLKLFETDEDKSHENENSINEAPEAVVAQGPQTELTQEALQQPVSGPLLEQELADAINPPVITPALAPAPAHPPAHPPPNAGGAKNQPGTGTMGAAPSV